MIVAEADPDYFIKAWMGRAVYLFNEDPKRSIGAKS